MTATHGTAPSAESKKKEKRNERRERQQQRKLNERNGKRRGHGILGAVARFFGFAKVPVTSSPSGGKRLNIDTNANTTIKKEWACAGRYLASTMQKPAAPKEAYLDLVHSAAPIPFSPPTYRVSDIHPDPSIWLEECGMVRVKSTKMGDGGWTVVPRSDVLWDE
jgi:hypothetical protein